MHNHYFLFVIILFSGQLCAAEDEFGSEYKPYHYVGGWLRLQKHNATWEEARLRCHLEGGVVATAKAIDIMKTMMAEADPPVSAVFVGSPASSSFYPVIDQRNPNEDHCVDQEDCVLMSADGLLTPVNCSSSRRYFCYKRNVASNVNHCGTWNKDYQLDPRTGSCYKFHTTPRSWFGAAMACRAEQAHLTVVNSATEARVLKELFDKHPKETLMQTQDPDYVHIGFWDWKENEEWQSIFGQTFDQAGFGTWDKNEPNHTHRNEFCGTLHRNGRLNDYYCNAKEAFICEISTSSVVNDSY